MTFRSSASGVEHPLLVAVFGVIGGIYGVYAEDLTPMLIEELSAMVCDVHIHQEVKISGQWEHYRETRLPRDYAVFAKMAGVRGSETPIAEPRGIPGDATRMTRFCCDHDGEDGHTHSWLCAAEIVPLEDFIKARLGNDQWRLEMDGWGYLFGNSWGGFTKYPDERPEGLEDVRFVFWFDN